MRTTQDIYHLIAGTSKNYNQGSSNHFISGTSKNYNQDNSMGLSPYSTMNDTLLLAHCLLPYYNKGRKPVPGSCHTLTTEDALTHQVYGAFEKAEQKGWGSE